MKNKNKVTNFILKYWREILIVLSGFVVIHLFLLAPAFNDWSIKIVNPAVAGQFGDFIGGYIGTIFLLISIILLYLTLKSQREMFTLQQFESKFFETLRIARANSSEVESKGKSGRTVFIDIKDEIEDALELITKNDEANQIDEIDKINIAYLITFYGVNNSLGEQLRNEVSKIVRDKKLIENIISIFEGKHNNIKLENATKPKDKRVYLQFDGHQSRLGHYFRHLYQAINYVDDQTFLSYEQKYFYIRTLRAQWSTHEQAIFFFNALSSFGKPWELTASNINKKLITKYNLIKNIPNGFIRGINLKKYFPDIKYEGEAKTEKRMELERQYF